MSLKLVEGYSELLYYQGPVFAYSANRRVTLE